MPITDGLRPLAVDINSLTQLEGNPRRGDVNAVAASLERFGQRKPIVVRASDRQIIAGNHTWQAAKQLGWDEIAAVMVDDDDVTAHAFALADNRTAELGGYDEDLLIELIRSVGDIDPALLADTGWDQDSIAELLGDQPEELPENPPEDAAHAAPSEPFTQPGQIWLLGDHRLAVGDCTDPTIYTALMNGDVADVVITDPPYNVQYEGGTKDALTIANDAMSETDFRAFLLASYQAMFANTREGGAIYVFHADSAGQSFRTTFSEAGWLLKQVLIWVKDRFVLSRQDYHWQHEPILYGWKPGAAHSWFGDRTRTTVFDDQRDIRDMRKDELLTLLGHLFQDTTVIREARPVRNADHPTMKPIALISRLLLNSTRPTDIALDPFGGSGSTLMACEYANRRARLIELDPRYADVICRRWQEYTGSLPRLQSSGKAHDFAKDSPHG